MLFLGDALLFLFFLFTEDESENHSGDHLFFLIFIWAKPQLPEDFWLRFLFVLFLLFLEFLKEAK